MIGINLSKAVGGIIAWDEEPYFCQLCGQEFKYLKEFSMRINPKVESSRFQNLYKFFSDVEIVH